MMKSGIPYQKAFNYIKQGRKQELINTYPNLFEGVAVFNREFSGEGEQYIYAVAKTQCPDAF